MPFLFGVYSQEYNQEETKYTSCFSYNHSRSFLTSRTDKIRLLYTYRFFSWWKINFREYSQDGEFTDQQLVCVASKDVSLCPASFPGKCHSDLQWSSGRRESCS